MGKKRRDIPVYDHPILETHCHLDYLKDMELEDILDKSLAHNIDKVITISVTPDNLQTAFELACNHEFVYCTQGIHPHDASKFEESTSDHIKKNLTNPKVVAVGEIGLDFYYNKSPKEKQIEVFKTQLEIAIEYNKPVVIHTRDAEKETMEILREYAPKMPKKGVIHSFTSSLELATLAIDLGFYLGFNGIITFKTAQNVRDVLIMCPLDRILLETDAPFLTPDPYRGKENAPYYLPFIAEHVAKVKEVELEDVLKSCYQNSLNCFNL